MRIEARIIYWDEGVLTFDPEKVLNRLEKTFPQVDIDPLDYSPAELEQFIKYADENIPESNRTKMIQSMRGKHWANGPVFKFQINVAGETATVTDYAKRYSTVFLSETKFDRMTEKKNYRVSEIA